MKPGSYSLDREPQAISFATPLYFLTADYAIQKAGPFSRSILGGGKLKVALAQNTLQFSWDLSKIEKYGERYLRYDNQKLSLKTERIFYNFNDLHIPDKASLDEFISKHKEIVDYRIRPAVEQVTLDYIKIIVNNFLARVPIKDIFDP
ncbi:hypothetical protein Trydic_g9008 [Trypoxylus dichotomus]